MNEGERRMNEIHESTQGRTVASTQNLFGFSVCVSYLPLDDRYEMLITSPDDMIEVRCDDFADSMHKYADAVIRMSAVVDAILTFTGKTRVV
jgi:hypothetical protein